MAQVQNILQQLQQMGLLQSQQGYYDIAGIDPGQISSSLASTYGLEPSDIPSHLFQGIPLDFLQAGVQKTYSPLLQSKTSSLLDNLYTSLSGKGAKTAAGGLAPGARSWGRHKRKARDVFGGEAATMLSGIGESRAAGLQNIQDMINQYRETAMDIKGYSVT